MTQHDLFGDLLPISEPPAAKPARRVKATVPSADQQLGQLASLIREAAAELAGAATAAEILESREKARAAVASAEGAARLAKAGRAHASVLAALHRAQGAALLVEFHAKIRLSEEYQAAVERGEVAVRGRPQKVGDPDHIPTVVELGLSRQEIHEGRKAALAERAAPGMIRAALEQMLADNRPPSRAGVVRAFRSSTSTTHSEPGRRSQIERLCAALSLAINAEALAAPASRTALLKLRDQIDNHLT